MGEAKRRAIPSLKEWLAQWKSVDEAAPDDFDNFTEWTARLLDLQSDDPKLARCLRILKTMSIAIVESANYESKLGANVVDIHIDIMNQMGIAFGYAMMGLSWKDETPFHSIARPLGEEFTRGLKFAIDACLEHESQTRAAHV